MGHDRPAVRPTPPPKGEGGGRAQRSRRRRHQPVSMRSRTRTSAEDQRDTLPDALDRSSRGHPDRRHLRLRRRGPAVPAHCQHQADKEGGGGGLLDQHPSGAGASRRPAAGGRCSTAGSRTALPTWRSGSGRRDVPGGRLSGQESVPNEEHASTIDQSILVRAGLHRSQQQHDLVAREDQFLLTESDEGPSAVGAELPVLPPAVRGWSSPGGPPCPHSPWRSSGEGCRSGRR